ncbi:MAG: type IV pilus assembly protein PilM [Chthonomonadales bacterium]
MAKSGGPTVGLDIGSKHIKVAELVPGRNGPTLRALGVAPTPAEAVENSVIVDPQLLGQAVKKLLKESGISTKNSVSSLSGQTALVVRVIEVPRMSESELAETMKWEVERHVPFAASEVIMDFQPIEREDTPADAQNMEVLLAVAQQDMVDRHVEMLFAAGLSPSAIDVEPLAVSRSLIELGPDPYGHRTIAIINIGASNTDIGIFRDGILAFPRTLPLAGDSLTRAIAAQMGVTEDQAEELKLKYGEVIMDQPIQQAVPPADAFLDFGAQPTQEEAQQPSAPMPFDFSTATTEPAQPAEAPAFDLGEEPAENAPVPAPVAQHDPTTLQMFSAMAPVLGELLTELRRSLEYYRGRTSDGQIDEILLCGGSSRLKGLAEFLSSELQIPARVADPLQYVTVNARNFSQEYLAELAPSLAVAIGLAARDMVAGPVPAGGGKRGKKR